MSTLIQGKTFATKFLKDGGTHSLLLSNAKDQVYDACKFIGDGIRMDGCNGITILPTCEVSGARRPMSSVNPQALYLSAGNLNINFSAKVTDCTQVGQIYGTSNFTVKDTTWSKCDYGLKASMGGAKNWSLSGVLMDRFRAMGLEFQYDDAGTDYIYVGGCAYANAERWLSDSPTAKNVDDEKTNANAGAKMAYSLPFTKATHVIFENNYAGGPCQLVDAPGQTKVSGADWVGIRIGAEIGGNGVIARGNWFDRVNRALSLINGSANWSIVGNLVTACRSGVYMDGQKQIDGNDGNVVLPPLGGWIIAGVMPPGIVIPPVIPPVDPRDAQITQLQATVANWQRWLSAAPK